MSYLALEQQISQRAARAYMSLIDSLEQSVAQTRGYAYPIPRQDEMRTWLMFSLGGE